MKARRWAHIMLLTACVCGAESPTASPALTPDQARARGIFARVIAFKTSVGLGQVPVMANYLAGEFRAASFPESDIHVFPLGETGSLVVRYRGDGSGGKPILLMAHMDVVTAKREDWQRDPFTLVEENGYFFGRGTYDVKESLTSLTATFLRLKAEGFVPTRDLVLVFTGDEEVTQETTRDVFNNHRALVTADFALNTDAGMGNLDEKTGQPFLYSIGTAEKSYASYELTVRNPGGHSSQPRADNAIFELAAALLRIQAFQFPVVWNDTTLAYFRGIGALTAGALGKAMQEFGANPEDRAAIAALSANSTYAGMIRTTCVPTLLRGGHAENALPQSATVTVNCRIFPGTSPAAIKDNLQQIVSPQVEITILHAPFSSDASPLRTDVVTAVTRAVHLRHPGIPVVPKLDTGASDAMYSRAAGIPTYGTCEAFLKDSDDYSHGLNERLPVRSFYDGLEFWYALLKDLAGPPPPPHPLREPNAAGQQGVDLGPPAT